MSRAKDALDVGIVSADGARLASFYEQAFGFEPQAELVLPGVGCIQRLSWGESVLRILQPEEAPTGNAADGGLSGRPGYRYVTLAVDDVADAIAACERSGGEVAVALVEPRPGRLVAQVRDLDGNLIELAQDR